jgi:ankyrin repeat protein
MQLIVGFFVFPILIIHYLQFFNFSLTLKIAELLLQNGADPNALSRVGQTALVEAALSGKVKSVELLFEFGAKSDFIDNHGVHLIKVSSIYPDIAAIFSRADLKRIMEEREADKAAGLYHACDLCKATFETKRCTGVYFVFNLTGV